MAGTEELSQLSLGGKRVPERLLKEVDAWSDFFFWDIIDK